MSYPKYILGINELNLEIQNNLDKMILLIFTASWCGPCKKLKSVLFSEDNSCISKQYNDSLIILYIDVDEDKNAELSDIYKVSGMPTQVLIKSICDTENKTIRIEKVSEIIGYDIIKLKLLLESNL
jgi:thiol-disulfide isomerase/thioredoxin